MHIDKIKINNFKNYNSAEISFSSKINFLYGKNGAGKTNLLDAIYYLSYGKSMINSFDLENINHNKSFFMISGSYSNNKNYKCTFETSSTKKIFENENKYDNIKQHIGKIPLVFNLSKVCTKSSIHIPSLSSLTPSCFTPKLSNLEIAPPYVASSTKTVSPFCKSNVFTKSRA